ncbi:hypothetical protein [Pseudoduganella sp. R-43]|uniref:hypothetical protein n=1 Tax=Pseudoduganella sp. R-43 TaxID=3404063 RepID=UPI003CEE8E40
MMNEKNLAWSEEIGCEGGPVLVANLDDFAHWRGSEPFDASMATELHYWSPFTSELPEQWQPNGPNGHQYLAASNPSEAREQLMSLVLDLWPGTVIERTEPTWRAKRPDGKVLNVALSPDSEYDNATRNFDAERVHHFGEGASGYLWSAAPGMVRMDLVETRDCLVLSQVEFADDDQDAQRAVDHALSADWRHIAPALQYEVTAGPVVVAWSPNSARDLSKPVSHGDATPTSPGLLLDLATGGSGALLWLAPGLYESTLQYHEEGSWAISWCRLQRVDAL